MVLYWMHTHSFIYTWAVVRAFNGIVRFLYIDLVATFARCIQRPVLVMSACDGWSWHDLLSQYPLWMVILLYWSYCQELRVLPQQAYCGEKTCMFTTRSVSESAQNHKAQLFTSQTVSRIMMKWLRSLASLALPLQQISGKSAITKLQKIDIAQTEMFAITSKCWPCPCNRSQASLPLRNYKKLT